MELWLVRHGTTRANLEGRLQGTLPFPLSPEGRKEALLLARRLKGQRYAYIFCSSSPRARQTARLLARAVQGPPPLYTPLLQEYDWGILQGLTRREIGERYPALLQQMEEDFTRAEIPGAEGLDKLFRRVARFCRLLAALEQKGRLGRPVLIVSHGRFLQALIVHFLGHDRRRGWTFPLSPASLTILQGEPGGGRRLKLFNDRCHIFQQR